MGTSMHRGMVAVLAIWLAASACNFLSGASQVPTVPVQDIASTAAAMALTAQASAMPAPTVVQAAPAEELTWFPSTDSHCRSGPGIQYESLTVLWSGQRLAALGTDEGWNWVQVRMQLSTQPCWTRTETGNLSANMDRLPIISFPDPIPTATLPKPAASGSDIDVLRVGASGLEAPLIVYIDLRNNGPDDFAGLVRVVCTGQSKLRDAPYTQQRIDYEEYDDLTMHVGWTSTINTKLETDTSAYSYPDIQCTVSVPNNLDPNAQNNGGATAIP